MAPKANLCIVVFIYCSCSHETHKGTFRAEADIMILFYSFSGKRYRIFFLTLAKGRDAPFPQRAPTSRNQGSRLRGLLVADLDLERDEHALAEVKLRRILADLLELVGEVDL